MRREIELYAFLISSNESVFQKSELSIITQIKNFIKLVCAHCSSAGCGQGASVASIGCLKKRQVCAHSGRLGGKIRRPECLHMRVIWSLLIKRPCDPGRVDGNLIPVKVHYPYLFAQTRVF